MATSAFAGFCGRFEVSLDGGTTFVTVGEVRDVTVTVNMDEIDATSMNCDGWMENIRGLKSWEMSAEALYLLKNGPQTEIETRLFTGSDTFVWKFRPQIAQASGEFEKIYQGTGLINSYEVNGTTDDAVIVSIDIVGTGALTVKGNTKS